MALLMHLRDTQTHVSLLNGQNVCVGQGYLHGMKVGEILHTCAIHEDETVVFVTSVFDGNCTVDEPFRKLLSECERTFIRWKYQQLQVLPDNVLNNVNATCSPHENKFAAFEWTEADKANNIEREIPSLQRKKRTKKCKDVQVDLQSPTLMQPQSTNSNTQASASMQSDVHCQVHCKENPLVEKRTYIKVIRGPSQKSMERKIGEDRMNKISLLHVRRWIKSSTCVKQCLANIHEMEIMNVRYEVWQNHNKYDDRVTWILRQLWTFVKPNRDTGWLDFEFFVNGTYVCHACYAYVLGYTQDNLRDGKKVFV
jgi:hypothetical protein